MYQYKYSYKDSKTINKFGVDITLYGLKFPSANIVYEDVKEGHFEEFLNTVSTCIWFIIEGQGTFVIDDEKIEVVSKDIIAVPPNKRIHYFGNMKMVLVTAPAFDAKNERHIRDVQKEENPYSKS
jgi:cupin superfamily acireductone dioxygenase involved in methionine salvage